MIRNESCVKEEASEWNENGIRLDWAEAFFVWGLECVGFSFPCCLCRVAQRNLPFLYTGIVYTLPH